MTFLFLILISLLPFSAFAETPNYTPTHQVPHGWAVIPDGKGGVSYWPVPNGPDAYTAGVIGQGLTQQFKQTHIPPPVYTRPSLELPETPRQTYNDQAVHDRMYEYLSGR